MVKKILGILLILALLVTGYIYYEFTYRGMVEPKLPAKVTWTRPVQSQENFEKGLRAYERLYQSVMGAPRSDKSRSTYVIPGLLATKTLEGNRAKKTSICTSMTPQGIAVSDTYIFVSSYCHSKKHNSVIYMIHKETGKFIKEIVLKGKPHVGSLAYDEKHDNLWICGSAGGMAQANAISMSDINSYSLTYSRRPIKYTFENNVLQIPRSSFMTCYKDNLYIGFFTTNQNGVLNRYAIEDDGNIHRTYFGLNGLMVESGIAIDTAVIPKQAQGMSFYYDKLFMSQSLGIFPSRLMLFDNAQNRKQYRSEAALQSFRLPSMLEQVYVYEDELYMIFESAAYAYRDLPGFMMDRIVKMSLDDIKTMVDEDLQKEREEEKREIRLRRQERNMDNWVQMSDYPWIEERIKLYTP